MHKDDLDMYKRIRKNKEKREREIQKLDFLVHVAMIVAFFAAIAVFMLC